ncbi:prolipoprotein diacylglyceryl transferase [candidate division KSB1 bacterium]
MHPVLFKIGWFEAHTYGLLLMISFLLGIYISVKRAQKAGIDPNVIIDLSVVIIISSIIGARLLYVAFHFDYFRDDLTDIFNPFQSDGSIGIAGLTILGGVILAIICSYLYLNYKKQPILTVFNIFTPALALGIGITRIGCFFHGCCFGTECNSFLGVVFPPMSVAGAMFVNQPIHPTQLYASFGGFIIFAVLIALERKQSFRNLTFFMFLILYSISRFTIDIFRYYEESMVLAEIGGLRLSVNQGITILMVVIGLIGVVYLRKKEHESSH